MKLGIISDTHDNLEAIDWAFDVFKEENVELIVHCGDWVSTETLRIFGQKAKESQIPVKGVLGNNETEETQEEIRSIIESDEYPIEMSDDLYSLTFELGNLDFAICHGNDGALLESLVVSSEFDVVFRGHTHSPSERKEGETLIVNPGTLAKYTLGKPRLNRGRPTQNRGVAIFDTLQKNVKFIPLL